MRIEVGIEARGPVFRPRRVEHAEYDRLGKPIRLGLERGDKLLSSCQERRCFMRDSGSVRGLYYPPQGAVISALSGSVLAVAADARAGAETYGDWVSLPLDALNARHLLVPHGFLYGFASRSPDAAVSVSFPVAGQRGAESTVTFADPDLAIDWGIPTDQLRATPQDRDAPTFAKWTTPFQDWENAA